VILPPLSIQPRPPKCYACDAPAMAGSGDVPLCAKCRAGDGDETPGPTEFHGPALVPVLAALAPSKWVGATSIGIAGWSMDALPLPADRHDCVCGGFHSARQCSESREGDAWQRPENSTRAEPEPAYIRSASIGQESDSVAHYFRQRMNTPRPDQLARDRAPLDGPRRLGIDGD
jgi:hypothetical protein